ncbi:hypothetical protein [Neobacillus kokaensis]|uniref:Uncharacterized protein n=1 Tax=Neobacillus kokaensis TaxID=2759023 RepID=A0ABQ3NCJ7_9BACI|nr:hypothetical protein [Neobacillus kokaensis]GHI01641.1 hypothetical protein AM1BK_51830 [Neobacillus kokaensis]
MNILKRLFQKKESSCCNVIIEEIKEEIKSEPQDGQNSNSCN